mmetsp:Transcript_5885/g.4881  ORF Transcript_5885/g.4881 Transcript_5885/m.4881 type:complete len:103 (-) Transcript_5885:66-374(-)
MKPACLQTPLNDCQLSSAELAVSSSLAAIIGLMGGLSYVNCMYQIQQKDDIPDDLRQLAVNLGFASTNIGIVLSSGLDLWLASTVLSQCNIYDCSKPPQIYN